MIRGQKWDNLKSYYGAYFYNVRNRLSVRDGILLYDDRAVIPKQLRQILVDSLHLTHPGQGGMLEAAKTFGIHTYIGISLPRRRVVKSVAKKVKT